MLVTDLTGNTMSDQRFRILIIDSDKTFQSEPGMAKTTAVENKSIKPDKNKPFNQMLKKSVYAESDFLVHYVATNQEAAVEINTAIDQKFPYCVVFLTIETNHIAKAMTTIQKFWSLDADIQMIISFVNCDCDESQIVEMLGINDNYLLLNNPKEPIAFRQLIFTLAKKWEHKQQAKHHTSLILDAVDEQTHTLQHSVSLLRSTIDSSTDGILVVDLNQQVIDYNKKFVTMWNLTKSLIQSRNLPLIMAHMQKQLNQSCQFRDGKLKEIDKFLGIQSTTKQIVTCKNGSKLECYSQPHKMNGQLIGHIWNYHDITERAKLELKLEFQASHDILTGLPNRIIVVDRLLNAIGHAQRNKKGVAVLFIDLDRFKLVNDSMNHSTGDELLRQIAVRLSDLVRKDDTLARLGGDEFIMIIPDLDKDEYSVNVAAKILKSFKEPFPIAEYKVTMTPSIGISIYPSDGKNVDELLRNADLAMYQAKAHGGNQFRFYTKELNKQTNQRFKIEAELSDALANKEFFMVYQPQFDMDTQRLLSIEALLRWNHPKRGCLAPIDFIRIAEESGLIIPIGEWVLREVCSQIKTWQSKKIPIHCIAINIATQQIKQVNFAATVRCILREYKVKPQFLEFEITENIVMTHIDVIQMINQLTELGIKIVLDDFGTGKSSLNYLSHIQIERLKIDHSFIKNIAHSRNDEAIIEAIIAMSHSFNFKVLAEGVEHQQQMTYLKQQNCDQVQGFLFSEPLTATSLEEFLKDYQPANIKKSQ